MTSLAVGALVLAAATSPAPSDLAVERLRVPARVTLDDRHAIVTRRATIRIANRGPTPAVIANAAVVRLRATAAGGPIACPPVGITSRLRFPLTVPAGRSRTLGYQVTFSCAPNPDRTPDWTFAALVGDVARAVAPPTEVRDARAGVRFALPGPYGVGTTSLALVDASRPTMANGAFPGAPDRTLPTAVWYPAAPEAAGPEAPLAAGGRPFPLVVFAHALGSYSTQSTFLTTHLASHGWVVAAPTFPLMSLGAPGGSTIADVAAQAGDVRFVIDALLAPASRFAGALDAERIGVAGHSGGALTILVATFDRKLRDPRIRAAVPFAPPACFLQPGYFDAAAVPLLVLQGDHDLLVDAVGDAGAVFERARPPKRLVVVHGGTHIGFADAGRVVDDSFVCGLFPARTTLDAELAALLRTLGGVADDVAFDGCPAAYCAGDTTHVDGRRQQQIGKEAALAFFEAVLRGDRTARRHLDRLAAGNPDLSVMRSGAQARDIDGVRPDR